MVRRTEGTLGYERTVALQFACHGMNLRRLQALAKRKRRQNARQTLSQHALSAAWRTYHNEVVAACCRYLQGTLHLFLTLHVSKVVLKLALLCKELSPRIDDGRLHRFLSAQVSDDLIDVAYTIDIEVVHHGSLAHVCLGNE